MGTAGCDVVGIGVADGCEVGVGSAGLKTGLGVGFGAAFIATPLFHTSLVPDLTQVYFFPADIDVAPAFVHFAPALTAAKDGAGSRDKHSIRARINRERVITQRYRLTIQI